MILVIDIPNFNKLVYSILNIKIKQNVKVLKKDWNLSISGYFFIGQYIIFSRFAL